MKTNNRFLVTIIWIFFYLALMDIAVNIMFRYPRYPQKKPPSAISQFFEYGRSVEGKLARMTQITDEESDPNVTWGWIQEPQVRLFSNVHDSENRLTITLFGMCYSVELAEILAKLDKSSVIRSIAAPAAVPTWAYSAYIADRRRQHSDIVILAVMTNGIPLICTTSGLTSHFDSVWPYTYPRYSAISGRLKNIPPPFLSLEGYREFFNDPRRWSEYRDWLERNDKYYDPLLFRKTFLDESSMMRMVRRAYAYSRSRKKEKRVYDSRTGFDVQSEEVSILRLLIGNFCESARRNNSLPIIYIVNNVNTNDHLFQVLEPTLKANKMLFLSSHEICPANDPSNFLANGHFVPLKNQLLAKAMLDLITFNMKADQPDPLKKLGQ